MARLIAFLLLASTTAASSPEELWPIDAQQNQRLDALEVRINQLFPTPKTEVLASVCPCQRSATNSCFCLSAGKACGCSAGVGSVWTLDANKKPAVKTEQKANPTTLKLIPATALPVKASSPVVVYQPQMICRGRRCRFR